VGRKHFAETGVGKGRRGMYTKSKYDVCTQEFVRKFYDDE